MYNLSQIEERFTMYPQIKGVIDTTYRAYPPIAMGICIYGITSEGKHVYAKPEAPDRTERMHNILNGSLAISALAAIYFSPVLSDLLNGTYYVSRYQADFYESKMKGQYHQVWKGFFIFAAATAFGLAAGGAITLPWTALLATRVAGRVLSTIETGLFMAMVAGAVRPTIKYLENPFMKPLPIGRNI